METTSNMILTAIFGGLAIWLLIGVVKTWGKTKYKDRTWTASRILFVVAAAMLVLTAFAYNDVWDIIRMAVMGAAIVAYLLMRDGIGEEGICTMGSFVPWSQVKSYDYQKRKKNFEVYFELPDKKEDYRATVAFDAKDEEEIKAFLKAKIGRKYRRMRKG